MRLTEGYTADIGSRFRYLILPIALFFILVLGRLYYLQVVKGSYYRVFSEKNSIREIKVPALRGMIFDRKGKILADNRAVFDVLVIPQYVENINILAESLEGLIGLPREELINRLSKAKDLPPFMGVPVKTDASLDDISKIMVRKLPWDNGYQDDEYGLRGVEIRLRYKRMYPDGSLAPHVLGYLREIDGKRLERYRKMYPGRYFLGDLVGVGGVEETWDVMLRGVDGFEQKVVNALGREVDYSSLNIKLERVPPSHGYSLKLTLDADLQRLAKGLMKDKSGAVVAIDPKTGGILVLYSSPGYDLNLLEDPVLAADYWREISTSEARCLYNRAIQGLYPPGSVYKIVTALAALENGAVNADENVLCRGGLKFGERYFRCWRSGGHGSVSLLRAIAESCDVFFYKMGLRVGVDGIAEYGRMLGFGEVTGIDLPGERGGIIPTSEWKLKRFGKEWTEGETLSVSIGQGYNAVTPLQAALATAMIANGGKKIKPHLVDTVIDAKGDIIYSWRENEGKTERLKIDPRSIEMVKKGMMLVVESPAGTAHRLAALKLKIAGKTGTSQVVSHESGLRGGRFNPHAWFVSFAPYDNPVIAVAVLVEHGGHGGGVAAPIAGEIIKEYLVGQNILNE